MVSEKLKLGSDFQIDHSDKTDTFDVLKHFTGIDLEQDRDPRTIVTQARPMIGHQSQNNSIQNLFQEIKILNFETGHVIKHPKR